MATKRFFNDGVNVLNGYTINVTRFVSSQQKSGTSRIAAKHWGTITTPDGDVIDMGSCGLTTTQIKEKIGLGTIPYNRVGESSELKVLIKAKSTLESLGLSTAEIDEKISIVKLEIEERANRQDHSKEIKSINKEMSKLSKLRDTLISMSVSTTEIDEKIALLQSRLDELTD